MRYWHCSLLILFQYSFSFGQAERLVQTDTSSWQTLDEVEVNALSIAETKFNYAGSVGIINEKTLAIADPTLSTGVVNAIPGVFWHSGALNTNRITIRGVGSRSPFSTNKIRAYYEDIPLTDGGGETTIEDIDLSFVGEIEIQKGANSSMYGSGLGGTIFLKKPSFSQANLLQSSTTFGSYGLVRTGLKGYVKTKRIRAVAGVQHQQSDGYRNNNEFDRQTFFSSINYKEGKTTVNLLLLFLDQKAFIPSSIGLTDFENNPRVAAANWQEAMGFEDYQRLLLGLSWERRLSETAKVITSVYTVNREAYEPRPRPIDILEERTNGLGLRTRWQKTATWLSLNVGIEAYRDTYRSRIFENLYEDNNPEQGSVQGAIEEDSKQPRSYLNLFLESNYNLGESFQLSLGANVNQTSYRLERSLPEMTESKNSFDPIFSPRVALTYSVNPSMNLYASLSHGFSPPSVDEITNEDGSLNTSIKPEVGWNREVGLKHFGNRFNYEVSLYSMDIQDLLVTRRTAEDIVFGVNAGKTTHNGVELDFHFLVLENKHSQLKTSVSYSFNDYTFNSFVDDQNDFSGNELTGIPQNQLNLSIDYVRHWFFSGVSYQYIDSMPITDDNSVYSEAYSLLNFHAGANYSLGEKWKGNFVLRFNNLTDERYASMLSINARAFGSEPRYYYPGLPFNYQISASLKYTL